MIPDTSSKEPFPSLWLYTSGTVVTAHACGHTTELHLVIAQTSRSSHMPDIGIRAAECAMLCSCSMASMFSCYRTWLHAPGTW